MKQHSSAYTEGPIIKSLFALAVPIVFANILQTAYQLTDTFWVGKLGAEAVAAVSLSFPIIFLMISLGGGLAIAGTILVAQYTGKKDKEQANYVAAQTLLMMAIVSIVVSIVGYQISEPIMTLMGAEPEVLPGAVSYLQVSFIGLVFMFAYFVFQSLMRGVGDVKTPLYIVLGTVLLNLILDPLFINGWGPIPAYGVTGAALATIGTQGIAAIVGLIMLFSGKYEVHLERKNLRIDFPLIKRMFLLGFPSSIEQSTRALGMTIMSFLVAGFGTITVASYGIGTRILSFVIIPAMGLAMATSTLVGQNIGAGKTDRAEKISQLSAGLGFIILSGLAVLTYFFAEPLTAAFIPGDQEVISMGSQFVKIMAVSFGFIGLQQTLNGTFMGSGNTMISMVLSIVSLWVFRFPLAYILSYHTSLGAEGIWWSFPIGSALGAISAFVVYKSGGWKKKNLLDSNKKLQKEVSQEAIIEEGVR